MFRYVICDQWRRIGYSDEITEPRPHLVPETQLEREFVEFDIENGSLTGLTPGEAFIDGEWVKAYRFKVLTPADGLLIASCINKALGIMAEIRANLKKAMQRYAEQN